MTVDKGSYTLKNTEVLATQWQGTPPSVADFAWISNNFRIRPTFDDPDIVYLLIYKDLDEDYWELEPGDVFIMDEGDFSLSYVMSETAFLEKYEKCT